MINQQIEAGEDDPEDEEAMLRGLDDELGDLGGNEEEQDLEEEDEPDPAIHQAELETKVK